MVKCIVQKQKPTKGFDSKNNMKSHKILFLNSVNFINSAGPFD